MTLELMEKKSSKILTGLLGTALVVSIISEGLKPRPTIDEISLFSYQGKPASLSCETYKGIESYYFVVDGNEVRERELITDDRTSYSLKEDRSSYLQMSARLISDPNDIILLPHTELPPEVLEKYGIRSVEQ